MKNINFEEYKHRVNRKEVKQNLAEMVINLERFLLESKQWIIVVLIPFIELLISIVTLIANHNDNRDYY